MDASIIGSALPPEHALPSRARGPCEMLHTPFEVHCLVRLAGTLERFPAKWKPVRVKKTRQIKKLEPRSDSIGTEKALVAVAGRTRFGQFAKHLGIQHHDGAMLQTNPVARG